MFQTVLQLSVFVFLLPFVNCLVHCVWWYWDKINEEGNKSLTGSMDWWYGRTITIDLQGQLLHATCWNGSSRCSSPFISLSTLSVSGLWWTLNQSLHFQQRNQFSTCDIKNSEVNRMFISSHIDHNNQISAEDMLLIPEARTGRLSLVVKNGEASEKIFQLSFSSSNSYFNRLEAFILRDYSPLSAHLLGLEQPRNLLWIMQIFVRSLENTFVVSLGEGATLKDLQGAIEDVEFLPAHLQRISKDSTPLASEGNLDLLDNDTVVLNIAIDGGMRAKWRKKRMRRLRRKRRKMRMRARWSGGLLIPDAE